MAAVRAGDDRDRRGRGRLGGARLSAVLNRIGGVVIAGEIAMVVLATGGAASPYGMLYGILLIYATMFYSTRRLAATAAVLLVLCITPHAAGIVHHATAHWPELAIAIGFWSAIGAVTRGLMNRVRAQTRALEVSEQRYRSLFAENPQGVFGLGPDGKVTSVNAAAGRLLGVDADTLIGREFREFVAAAVLPEVEARFCAVLSGEPQQFELDLLRPDGGQTPTSVNSVPVVVDDEVVGVHGVIEDISDRKELEERLTHAAAHDPLTGLANRALLADRLRHALHAATRTGRPVALLVLDLDGFKPVNDTHGHATGDALLVEITARKEPATCPRARAVPRRWPASSRAGWPRSPPCPRVRTRRSLRCRPGPRCRSSSTTTAWSTTGLTGWWSRGC